MAEDKKSFVLYTDLLKSIDHLTIEEKGILFNHLLEYVNDKNPTLTDRVILGAWKPLEAQLKRDLIKFEVSKEERQRSGRIGNLKRWHPDLYVIFNNGENSLEELEVIAENRKSSHSDKERPIAIAKIANIAVNDNVTVNVNDINNISTSKNKFSIDWSKFIETYNSIFNRKIKMVNPKVKTSMLARLKEGYTNADIYNAMLNVSKDKFHQENGFKHATPEYFSRAKTLDMHQAKPQPAVWTPPHPTVIDN